MRIDVHGRREDTRGYKVLNRGHGSLGYQAQLSSLCKPKSKVSYCEQQSSGMAKLLLVSNIQQKRSVTSSRMVGGQESATDSKEMLWSLSI